MTDLIAAVLIRVSAQAVETIGHAPGEVVLTHPANWGPTRLRVLEQAAATAGFGGIGLLAEPVAAAAYFTGVLGKQFPPDRHMVVYDLGAGTFDVALIRSTPSGPEVVATGGLADLGGLDLDAVVVDHVRALTVDHAPMWGRLGWPQTSVDRQGTARPVAQRPGGEGTAVPFPGRRRA